MNFIFNKSKEWKELKRFEKLPSELRKIVFYSENEFYTIHFEKLMRELTDVHKQTICYVTSSKTDPLLNSNNEKILSFFIGDGIVRTDFFINLKADISLMTMPDLQTFHVKRSKVYPVHYVYIFHSIVSTHMIYRKKAFDNFDTIFCVGKHHFNEIVANEKKYDLPSKNLIEYGYGKLDQLINENEKRKQEIVAHSKKTILIAPSWDDNGLIETEGMEIIQILLDNNYNVILRPHPVTLKKSQNVIKNIQKKFQKNTNFDLDVDIRNLDSFFTSDCMISDWSGVAIEYAFALKKPVLYVDIQKKINNSDYRELNIIPIEEKIRAEIGTIISPNELAILPKFIEDLCSKTDQNKKNVLGIRKETVFNLGTSEQIGAQVLLELLKKKYEK